MRTPTYPTTIFLENEDIINLREYARANRMTASRVMRGLIREHIPEYRPAPPGYVTPNPGTWRSPKAPVTVRLEKDVIRIVEGIMDRADVKLNEAVNFLIRRGARREP